MKKLFVSLAFLAALMSPLVLTAADSVCTKNGQVLPDVKDKKTCKQQGGSWGKTHTSKAPKKTKSGN
jgi:hypothetical protein